MALNWDFKKDHYGKLTVERNMNGENNLFDLDIYAGNSLAIFVYNYEQDGKELYNLHFFFLDKDHAKRMLGTDKKYKETYGTNKLDDDSYKFVRFELDKTRKESRELARLIMDADWKNAIEIKLV